MRPPVFLPVRLFLGLEVWQRLCRYRLPALRSFGRSTASLMVQAKTGAPPSRGCVRASFPVPRGGVSSLWEGGPRRGGGGGGPRARQCVRSTARKGPQATFLSAHPPCMHHTAYQQWRCGNGSAVTGFLRSGAAGAQRLVRRSKPRRAPPLAEAALGPLFQGHGPSCQIGQLWSSCACVNHRRCA